MKTALFKQPSILKKIDKAPIDITHFYDQATEDYHHWSKDFNMHFGYFSPLKTTIVFRDSMLNEMNHQVLKRIALPKEKSVLIDLGCGMGGTMRYALKHNHSLSAIGVTLSQVQVGEGNRLLAGKKGFITKEDFNHTSFKTNSFDGALAIESFCHSGHDRKSFKEAHRLLKPNSRLVIADAFIKKDVAEMCPSSKLAYSKLCRHWGLEKLGAIDKVISGLKAVGFKKVVAEDISLRVAPSVLHVPFAITSFIVKKFIKEGSLKTESWHNLKGSFYALLSELHLKNFGYYLVTCTK